MLHGKALGAAIAKAIDLMKERGYISHESEVAGRLGVKKPSVVGWKKTGTISKEHWLQLLKFCAPVADYRHWGMRLEDWPVGLISRLDWLTIRSRFGDVEMEDVSISAREHERNYKVHRLPPPRPLPNLLFSLGGASEDGVVEPHTEPNEDKTTHKRRVSDEDHDVRTLIDLVSDVDKDLRAECLRAVRLTIAMRNESAVEDELKRGAAEVISLAEWRSAIMSREDIDRK